MLKKTTVYLGPEDILLLRKMANIKNVTIAEAIRISIQEACRPKTLEEKTVWNALDKIWAKTENLLPKKIKSRFKTEKKEAIKKNNRRF